MTLRTILSADQLLAAAAVEGPVSNEAFLPVGVADDPRHELEFAFSVKETLMLCNRQAARVNGLAVDLFPAIDIRLAVDDGHLVPLDRDGVGDSAGPGYWKVIFSPGRVWSESGDGSWSRAALPFQFSNKLENVSHHGIASFLYSNDEISAVFFQIVAQGKALLCPDNLQAWGWLQPLLIPVNADDAGTVLDNYYFELQGKMPVKALTDWQLDSTNDVLADIAGGPGSETTIVDGLVIDDVIYATPSVTSMGPYPIPESMRFSVSSVNNAAFCTLAMLRLAQLIGEDPRNFKIIDLLPAAKSNPCWIKVTIGDCLNMSTGIGMKENHAESSDIFADYYLTRENPQASEKFLTRFNHQHARYQSQIIPDKNTWAFAGAGYPWAAGAVARYRDEDLYIAAAALDALLKKERGPRSRLWTMVNDEVFKPAKIRHAVHFHTIENDDSSEFPLADADLLFTMNDVACLGRLIINRGKISGQYLLQPDLLGELFYPVQATGLPTGLFTRDGEIHYHAGLWYLPYRCGSGNLIWIPTMQGYGGLVMQILPNAIVSFRFGFDSISDTDSYPAMNLVRLADQIRPFD